MWTCKRKWDENIHHSQALHIWHACVFCRMRSARAARHRDQLHSLRRILWSTLESFQILGQFAQREKRKLNRDAQHLRSGQRRQRRHAMSRRRRRNPQGSLFISGSDHLKLSKDEAYQTMPMLRQSSRYRKLCTSVVSARMFYRLLVRPRKHACTWLRSWTKDACVSTYMFVPPRSRARKVLNAG